MGKLRERERNEHILLKNESSGKKMKMIKQQRCLNNKLHFNKNKVCEDEQIKKFFQFLPKLNNKNNENACIKKLKCCSHFGCFYVHFSEFFHLPLYRKGTKNLIKQKMLQASHGKNSILFSAQHFFVIIFLQVWK